jgi:hypothetical protein
MERGHLVRLSAQRELFRKGILIAESWSGLCPLADRMSALPVADLIALETPGDSGAILASVPVILRSNDRPRS